MSAGPSLSPKIFCRIVTVAQPPFSCSLLLCRFMSETTNMLRSRILAAVAAILAWSGSANAQSSVAGRVQEHLTRPSPAEVVREVRSYREANEDRILRELREFLAIPNVAGDTAHIQKNAMQLKELLEARGIETHLLSIENRGPVVFGKLDTLGATRTVIFYAHYDGQPVVASEWTDKAPFEPVLRDDSIEAGGSRIPFPDAARNPNVYRDSWRIYVRSASDDKSPIVGILAALDALREKNIPLAVSLKFIL